MKNIFFAITLAAFIIIFISCGNIADKKTNTHTHDDGTEHNNHNHAYEAEPEQEVFELKGDSLPTEKDTLMNEHKNEHSHTHEDGHEHTH